MTLIEQIAEKIAAIRYDGLPQEAVLWAKAAILDTVGVTLAGAREDCTRIVEQVLAAESHGGDSLVFGSERRVAPLVAALINGTAAHALDFDDVSNSLGGHPSAPILPALFALADSQDCAEKPLGARPLSPPMSPGSRPRRGSPAASISTTTKRAGTRPRPSACSAPTAACCHLMRLTVAQTAQALAIAASFASGIKANFGTMTKPLHVGHTARDGLFAAMLARGGFTANNGAMEHPQGFLMVYNGEGNFDAAAMLKDWGNPYDVVRPGAGVQAIPVLRQHAPAARRAAGVARGARDAGRQGGAHRLVDASAPPRAHQPARPQIRARRQVLASNTASPARRCRGKFGSRISRATPMTTRRCGR